MKINENILWLIVKISHSVKVLGLWFRSKRKTIAKHLNNLGVAGYTGAYAVAISDNFDFNASFYWLLISGILFTMIASYLTKD